MDCLIIYTVIFFFTALNLLPFLLIRKKYWYKVFTITPILYYGVVIIIFEYLDKKDFIGEVSCIILNDNFELSGIVFMFLIYTPFIITFYIGLFYWIYKIVKK